MRIKSGLQVLGQRLRLASKRLRLAFVLNAARKSFALPKKLFGLATSFAVQKKS